MAETGIEDFARNPMGGCLGSIGPAIIVFVILIGALVLISSYCDPGNGADPKPVANTTQR